MLEWEYERYSEVRLYLLRIIKVIAPVFSVTAFPIDNVTFIAPSTGSWWNTPYPVALLTSFLTNTDWKLLEFAVSTRHDRGN